MTQGVSNQLHEQPWWTDADQAELDVLTHAFVKVALVHKERCPVCSSGGPWCAQLLDAWSAVTEWRAARILRSRAEWLRIEQRLREFAA